MKTKTEENLETLNAYAKLMGLPLVFAEDWTPLPIKKTAGAYLKFVGIPLEDQGSKKYLRFLNPSWLECAGPEEISRLLRHEYTYMKIRTDNEE